MSLDKKAILKDIEVLIRSIKVHYDNIENEYRIPTIELELITSKIRKLHEKSIVYNHLHYLEEEQILHARRLKLDQLIFKHEAEETPSNEFEPVEKNSGLYDAQVKFEEKVSELQKEKVAETEVEPVAEGSSNTTEKLYESPVEAAKTVTNSTPENNYRKVQLSSKIGINDRFRFIKNLFGGNGTALEEAIKEIESCNSMLSLTTYVNSLKQKYSWNEEDETVIDFMALLK